jgi:hypothetical protein
MLKKVMLLLAAVVLMAGVGAGTAFAAESAVANIYLNCTVTLSVTTVSPDNMYNFGNVAANSVALSTSPIVFRNDSNGAVCKWELNVANPSGWTIGNVAGLDTFSLCAVFKKATAIEGDYNVASDTLSVTGKDYNATSYSMGDYTAEGIGSDEAKILPFAYDAAKADRKLWLRLATPIAVTTSGNKTIPLTITAKIAG